MAVKKILLVYIGFDILFLACAGMLIGLPLGTNRSAKSPPSISSIAQTLLLDTCPLTALLVNGALMALAFLISIPGMFLKENRRLLTIHAWLVVLSAVFTLGLGLVIWVGTLQTKKNLIPLWTSQNSAVLSLLQRKFQCCGYQDTTKFIVDDMCTNVVDAARHGSCLGPFSAFANNFLDIVFTALFGVCAVDAFLVLSVICVLKERGEQARYRRIDEKNGYSRG